MVDRIYTVEEVADVLRVSIHTVRRYLKAGKLGGFRAGRDWRVTESDLEAFIDQARAERTDSTPFS